MPMIAKLLLSICSCALSEETVSLLQTHVTRKYGETFDHNTTEDWAQGFNQCRGTPRGHHSKCKRLFMNKNGTYKDARECAMQARTIGGDTFNFLPPNRINKGMTRCVVQRCGTTSMEYSDKPRKPWLIYSRFCGLQLVKHTIPDVCDKVTDTKYLKYLAPPKHACETPLNFGKGMKNNNLNGLGPAKNGSKSMRFRSVLPGIDLKITTTDSYRPANTKKNGRYKKWGASVNLAQDTETHFLFTFLESKGQKKVKVPSFMFSVFDLDQSRECMSRTFVNASGYSGYYVSEDTELKITTRTPKPAELEAGAKPSTKFESTMKGGKTNNPKNPMDMTPDQASRAVTFVYENVKQFYMGFGVTDGETGRNIVFAGSSSITESLCKMPLPDPPAEPVA